MPRSDGEKVYLEAVYRMPKLLIAVIFAFQTVALGFTASGCIVFAFNLVVAAGKEALEWEERGVAVGVFGGDHLGSCLGTPLGCTQHERAQSV
ncbi:High affinity methionine permease [Penicillium argentinense]|uniref:High affinity methionine permease n=1 Tax=Penicillium argentinense TaxID=1131581 RepID=A0A9W9KCM0_9EURO|nr:High affinity methionine permease [Penicillium argentinense]KAJ5100112.1 High affinity methionine permease [Penicillium argentinense]